MAATTFEVGDKVDFWDPRAGDWRPTEVTGLVPPGAEPGAEVSVEGRGYLYIPRAWLRPVRRREWDGTGHHYHYPLLTAVTNNGEVHCHFEFPEPHTLTDGGADQPAVLRAAWERLVDGAEIQAQVAFKVLPSGDLHVAQETTAEKGVIEGRCVIDCENQFCGMDFLNGFLGAIGEVTSTITYDFLVNQAGKVSWVEVWDRIFDRHAAVITGATRNVNYEYSRSRLGR